ncbi:MAG TPA: hypothetical protein VI136_16800 [Verrucomicrobiae bacterium]
MKTISIIAAQVLLATTCLAEGPIQIIGYEQGGLMTAQGATVSNYFTVEFATNPETGPWTNWGALTGQPITGAVMQAAGPMFFRIRQTDQQVFPPNLPLSQVWVSMHQGTNEYHNVPWFNYTDPSSSEGEEYQQLRLNVRPLSSSSKLLIEFSVHIGSPQGLGHGAGVFVFKDSETKPLFGTVREEGYALIAGAENQGHTETHGPVTGSYLMTNPPPQMVLKVRVASRMGNGANTVKLNNTLYGNYGNKLTSTLKVTEIR